MAPSEGRGKLYVTFLLDSLHSLYLKVYIEFKHIKNNFINCVNLKKKKKLPSLFLSPAPVRNSQSLRDTKCLLKTRVKNETTCASSAHLSLKIWFELHLNEWSPRQGLLVFYSLWRTNNCICHGVVFPSVVGCICFPVIIPSTAEACARPSDELVFIRTISGYSSSSHLYLCVCHCVLRLTYKSLAQKPEGELKLHRRQTLLISFPLLR